MANPKKRREPNAKLKNFLFIIFLLLVAGFSYPFFSEYEQQENPTIGVNIIDPSKPPSEEKTSDKKDIQSSPSEQKEQDSP